MSLPVASAARLRRMGIQLWRLRARDPVPTAPRLRLEAGHGDVVIVADEDERSRYRTLLADLVASIGTARCRYGKWADSPAAGVSLDDCPDRGIEHVLAFGPLPRKHRCLISGAPLPELLGSGAARRSLWAQIADRCRR